MFSFCSYRSSQRRPPAVFASLDAPLPAAPSPQPADPRAARLAKFKREQRIVEYLNRGVAVV